MNHSRIAPLALVAATIAVVGCGSSSGSTTSLTSAQLRAKANPICIQANAALQPVYKITNFTAIPPAATKAAGEIRQASSELAGLKPPTSMEKDWKVVVSSYHTVATDINELGEHAKLTTKPDVAVIAKLASAQNLRTATAFKLGFNPGDGCRVY
jgi:hypothetical protein